MTFTSVDLLVCILEPPGVLQGFAGPGIVQRTCKAVLDFHHRLLCLLQMSLLPLS